MSCTQILDSQLKTESLVKVLMKSLTHTYIIRNSPDRSILVKNDATHNDLASWILAECDKGGGRLGHCSALLV